MRASSKKRNNYREKEITGWLFILPVIVGIVVFQAFPILESLYFSFFKRYNVITSPQGFGLFNYTYMFKNAHFLKSCAVTATYTVINVPLSIVLSFLLALPLNKKIKGVGIYRVLVYLPVIIPVTVNGIIWKNFFDVNYGLANEILVRLGFERFSFFQSSETAMFSFIVTGVWSLGGGMIMWLSALKNVPTELYEAANIDGANAFVKLIKITFPMCSPMFFYNLIMSVIGSLQTFGQVMTLTGGTAGPDDSLLFYVFKVYNDAFNIGAKTMGLACAESWVLFAVIAVLTAILFKTSKWVFYGEE